MKLLDLMVVLCVAVNVVMLGYSGTVLTVGNWFSVGAAIFCSVLLGRMLEMNSSR